MTLVRFRQFWGEGKRSALFASLDADEGSFAASYAVLNPTAENRFAFKPRVTGAEYRRWPRIIDLCGSAPISGLQEMRGEKLFDSDRKHLEVRMSAYADQAVPWEAVVAQRLGPTERSAGF